MKQSVTNLLSKSSTKMVISFAFMAVLLTVFSDVALANGGDIPEPVQGGKNLLDDLLFWLLFIVPAAAALSIGGLKLSTILGENEPSEIANKNKRMKQVLIAAVVAESASAIVKVFLGYFDGSQASGESFSVIVQMILFM